MGLSFSKVRDLANKEKGVVIADFVLFSSSGNKFVYPFNPIYNYNKKRNENCLVVLFIYFVSEGKKYPVDFDYWISNIYGEDNYLTKNEIFLNSIKNLKDKGLNFEHVLLDAGFFSQEVLNELLDLDIKFVIRSKSNKKTDESKKLNDLFVNEYNGSFYYYHRFKSFLIEKKISLNKNIYKLVAIANSKDKLINKNLFYLLSNDLSLKMTEILKLYKLRWSIESFFKILKSYLSLSVFYRNNMEYVQERIELSLISFMIVNDFSTEKPSTFYQKLKIIQNYDYNLAPESIEKYCQIYDSGISMP